LAAVTNLVEVPPSDTAHVEPASPERSSNYAGRGGAEIESKCPRCYGTGLEVVPRYNDPETGEPKGGARRCPCRSADPAKLFAAAQVPEEHSHCSFDNYRPEPGNGSQLKAFGYAYRFAKGYPVVERGLLLMGPCGVGKTHLMVAALRGLCGKGAQCLFKEFDPLLEEIKATYDAQTRGKGETETDLLAPLYDKDVLLLDELGTSRPTDWALDILGRIVNERYKRRKITLATTNCHDPERGPGWGFPPLADRVSARARSRLYRMCRTVVVEGEDYRKKFDEGDF
jgi:DNA replication protein DnaC